MMDYKLREMLDKRLAPFWEESAIVVDNINDARVDREDVERDIIERIKLL